MRTFVFYHSLHQHCQQKKQSMLVAIRAVSATALIMKRLAILAITIGVCIGILVIPATAEATQLPPGDSPDASAQGLPPGFSSWEEVFRVQNPLSEAANRLYEVAKASEQSGYAGITVSVEDRGLTLYWQGTLPEPMQQALTKERANNVQISVQSAPYSRLELDQQAEAIFRAGTLPGGVVVHAVGARNDGTGLNVGVHAAEGVVAGGDVAQAARTALQEIGDGVPVFVTEEAPPTLFLSRENDPNKNGGATIYTDNYACTSGFGASWPKENKSYVITAAHCGDIGSRWRIQDQSIGTAEGRDVYNDALFIATPGGAGDAIWDGPGYGQIGQFGKFVRGTAITFPDEIVCVSGSLTGVMCSLRVEQTNLKVKYSDNSEIHVNKIRQINNEPAAGNGDSGGPVFVPTDPKGVIARGLITGPAGTEVSCPNPLGGPPRNCCSALYVTDIKDALANYPGLHLNTQ